MDESVSPKVVVIGGGTGSFNLLSSLKHYVQDISAVVNMVDDGGSTGKLRDELGVLPPGDIRRCLVALSDAPEYLRDLFDFRFDEGDLAGHSFGNLFISALEKMNDSFDESIRIASEVLNVRGSVIPVTLDKTTLALKSGDLEIIGEGNIDESDFDGSIRPELWLTPHANLNPRAKKAIEDADIVVIAPGNVYGSISAAMITYGFKEAMANTNAKVVMVANLVNKKHQTNGFRLSDYIKTYQQHLEPGTIDYVLYNNVMPPQSLLDKYANDGELPVEFDVEEASDGHIQFIGEDLISDTPTPRSGNDQLMKAQRSYIRHDGDKVSRQIMRVYFS